MLVQLQGREVWYLQLNEAVSRRLVELMQERGMTQYQLYMKSGVPKSTIGSPARHIDTAFGAHAARCSRGFRDNA